MCFYMYVGVYVDASYWHGVDARVAGFLLDSTSYRFLTEIKVVRQVVLVPSSIPLLFENWGTAFK